MCVQCMRCVSRSWLALAVRVLCTVFRVYKGVCCFVHVVEEKVTIVLLIRVPAARHIAYAVGSKLCADILYHSTGAWRICQKAQLCVPFVTPVRYARNLSKINDGRQEAGADGCCLVGGRCRCCCTTITNDPHVWRVVIKKKLKQQQQRQSSSIWIAQTTLSLSLSRSFSQIEHNLFEERMSWSGVFMRLIPNTRTEMINTFCLVNWAIKRLVLRQLNKCLNCVWRVCVRLWAISN